MKVKAAKHLDILTEEGSSYLRGSRSFTLWVLIPVTNRTQTMVVLFLLKPKHFKLLNVARRSTAETPSLCWGNPRKFWQQH
jgi:hypothetical protein